MGRRRRAHDEYTRGWADDAVHRFNAFLIALAWVVVEALATVALFVGYVIAGSIVVIVLVAITVVYLTCAAVLLVMLTGARPIPYHEPMFYHVALVVSSPALVLLLDLAWRRWRAT